MISLNRTRRNLLQCIFALLTIVLLISICGKTVLEVQADEPVVVVIDPGHGGENLGGEYEEYIEKEMTMIVANAMKEELEKYDGIQVYMTRYGDIEEDMSLEERSEYAKSVDADFMFCLHLVSSIARVIALPAWRWNYYRNLGYIRGVSRQG